MMLSMPTTKRTLEVLIVLATINIFFHFHIFISYRLSDNNRIPVDRRVDCHPDPWKTENQSEECIQRGCEYEPLIENSPDGTPPCYFRDTGYIVTSSPSEGHFIVEKKGGTLNPFGTDISPLEIKVKRIGGTIQVSIGTSGRYTPPLDLPREASVDTDPIEFMMTPSASGSFGFKIVRNRTLSVIWDTSIGGFLFADKFIQIATFLPSTNIYGLGEHIHKTMKHNLTRYTTWPFWPRGTHPDSTAHLSTVNSYGVHTFYLCIESTGEAHGMFFLNSNAQEITLGPAPHLVYRIIGGQLDMVFFSGPTPEMVIQGYQAYIGRPMLPAYWALGFQISRFGYSNLTEMQEVVARNQAADIPLDVVHVDLDYMDGARDFTINKTWSQLPEYTIQLHSEGIRLILIFDPAVAVDHVSFERARKQNASFIEWPDFGRVPKHIQNLYPLAKDTKIMLGNIWPQNHTAFPDFLDPTSATKEWWIEEFVRFHDTVSFDGIWIDLNEPTNKRTELHKDIYPLNSTSLSCDIGSKWGQWDVPLYQTWAAYSRPNQYLCNSTLCLCGTLGRGSTNVYNARLLYGLYESMATVEAQQKAVGKRGIIISRSTFPSSGRYAGSWLGDNKSRWVDLQTSVIGVMEFNMFGIPYVGSDICGFGEKAEEELCLRWHQFGAFSSFSRNHNDNNSPPQDPAVWPSVAHATRVAMKFRYQYLPYLFSLHYHVAVHGGTVVRPLFFEFPADETAPSIDYQFLWGTNLMIAPAVHPNVTHISVYFPQDRWYSLHPWSYGEQMGTGWCTVAAPLDSLTPVFVRGGSILPRQIPSVNTDRSRRNPFELLIAMDSDEHASFEGFLYYDDGDSIYSHISQNPHFHFQFTFQCTEDEAVLTITTKTRMEYPLPHLQVLDILGYPFRPHFDSFTTDGKHMNIDIGASYYSTSQRLLYIDGHQLVDMNTVALQNQSVIRWTHRRHTVYEQLTNSVSVWTCRISAYFGIKNFC